MICSEIMKYYFIPLNISYFLHSSNSIFAKLHVNLCSDADPESDMIQVKVITKELLRRTEQFLNRKFALIVDQRNNYLRLRSRLIQ